MFSVNRTARSAGIIYVFHTSGIQISDILLHVILSDVEVLFIVDACIEGRLSMEWQSNPARFELAANSLTRATVSVAATNVTPTVPVSVHT